MCQENAQGNNYQYEKCTDAFCNTNLVDTNFYQKWEVTIVTKVGTKGKKIKAASGFDPLIISFYTIHVENISWIRLKQSSSLLSFFNREIKKIENLEFLRVGKRVCLRLGNIQDVIKRFTFDESSMTWLYASSSQLGSLNVKEEGLKDFHF